MFRQHIVKYYKFDGYVIENGTHQYVYFHTPIKFFVRFSTLSFENIFGHVMYFNQSGYLKQMSPVNFNHVWINIVASDLFRRSCFFRVTFHS